MSAKAVASALEKEPAARSEPLSGELRRFAVNVTALIVLGVSIGWWLLEFTDFFPAFGGFLGLGGIFAWIAFLSNLVSKTRKEQLQHEFERRFLLLPSTFWTVALLLLLFAGYAGLQGTIIIVAPNTGSKLTADVRAGGEIIETIHVPADGKAKTSLFLRPGRDVLVKIAGYPERRVALESFSRNTLLVPESFFTQPVLLARLDERFTVSSTDSSVRVRMKRRDKWTEYDTLKRGSYDGESLWIGSSPDVAVPPAVREEWGTVSQDLKVLYKWFHPRSVGADRPLLVGDVIRVCVFAPEGSLMLMGETTVLSPRQQPFPQQLLLNPATEKMRCDG